MTISLAAGVFGPSRLLEDAVAPIAVLSPVDGTFATDGAEYRAIVDVFGLRHDRVVLLLCSVSCHLPVTGKRH